MTTDELDLVETIDLVDALYRRQGAGGAILVATMQFRTEAESENQIIFRGGSTAALGLAEWSKCYIRRGWCNKPMGGDGDAE